MIEHFLLTQSFSFPILHKFVAGSTPRISTVCAGASSYILLNLSVSSAVAVSPGGLH